MCEFIHYKYKPKYLHNINYNPKIKTLLQNYSQGDCMQNLILYGPNGSGKKTFLNCYLNNNFNNDNSIYTTTTFNYTLSNNYKIHYKSSIHHYQIYLLDSFKNNILIIHELIAYLIQSKSILNTYIIIVLHNIERLEKNINLLKIIMEKYSHVKFICTSSKRHNELELAIQLRIEVISEFYLLKIAMNINKKQKIKLSDEKIISIVKNSFNNLNTMLNSIQSIINETEDNLTILNEVCEILEKKNIRDYPKVKQLLNKIIIFKSYNIEYIIHYIYEKIIQHISDKPLFIHFLANVINTTNSNIVKDIITLDTFIFFIYKMINNK
jgi:ABC-type branched-subunit amino acid transport system ATPase component